MANKIKLSTFEDGVPLFTLLFDPVEYVQLDWSGVRKHWWMEDYLNPTSYLRGIDTDGYTFVNPGPPYSSWKTESVRNGVTSSGWTFAETLRFPQVYPYYGTYQYHTYDSFSLSFRPSGVHKAEDGAGITGYHLEMDGYTAAFDEDTGGGLYRLQFQKAFITKSPRIGRLYREINGNADHVSNPSWTAEIVDEDDINARAVPNVTII